MRIRKGMIAAGAAGLLVAWPSVARAYCRATTCEPEGVRCEEPTLADCGIPLYWDRDCVGVGFNAAGTWQIPWENAYWAVMQSFFVWTEPHCDGRAPGLSLVDMGAVECGRVEYNATAGNVNLVVFQDGAWTHPESPEQVALTTVTFNKDTGEIYDVDIEINSALYTLTITETTTEYDLIAVLTHEAGHFFGLGHTEDLEATMYRYYNPGTVGQRTLEADDIRGICAVYPPREGEPIKCNPIPRHGFASECAANQPVHGCGVSPAGAGGATSLVLVLGGLAVLLARRREGR